MQGGTISNHHPLLLFQNQITVTTVLQIYDLQVMCLSQNV